MTPYQKRVITAVCQQWRMIGDDSCARVLDSHRFSSGRLAGVPRQEIIDYAHKRTGISKAHLNTDMR